MSRSVTVKFVDFWDGFDEGNNKFLSALRSRYDVTLIPGRCDGVPDVLFYSREGESHLDYEDSIKVYYTGENDVPDFNECDYAISFHHLDFGRRHLRYPLYMMYDYEMISDPCVISDDDAVARPFCSFLMRNHYNCDPRRIEIADAVEEYRPIAYGGLWRNNTGGPVADKVSFISGYKFNLALENSLVGGYVTEKILEPFIASTVPLYWGAPDVAEDFNPEAFVNIADYDSIGNFVKALMAIDRDREAYLGMLRAPKLRADRHVDFDGRLASFLGDIVESRRRYAVRYGESGLYHRRRILLRPFVMSRNFMRLAKTVRFFAKDLIRPQE